MTPRRGVVKSSKPPRGQWLAQSSSAKLMTLDDHLAKVATSLGIDVVP